MQNLFQHIHLLLKITWVQFIVFSGILWLIYVHLHINRHIEDMIIGPHYWRKSDTLAQIMNYYYNGLNFFDHGIYYNQMDSGGKAVAEFPLIYWLIALQLKIFGKHILIVKINFILLQFTGLFSVFKISNYFLKHYGLSLFIAFILFLSPIYSFYSIAFLPDVLALNIIFIGLLFLLKSFKNPKSKSLLIGLIFISIGGMIKPFFLIPYLAFLMLIGLNYVIKLKTIIQFKWQYLIPLFLVGFWFFYMNWYNQKVGSDYFLSETRPIWAYSSEYIHKIWLRIVSRWVPEYLNPSFLWLFLSLIPINLIWWKKDTHEINLFYLLSVLGSFSFIFLFYNMFENHDYYIFPVLFMIPLTVGVFVYKIKVLVSNKLALNTVAAILLCFLFLGLNYSWEINETRRYTPYINSNHEFKNYQNLEFFLTKNKVQKSDYIFAFSDKSPSFALSLLNRKGWSGFQTKPNKFELKELINKGASYLILNKNAPLLKNDSVIFNNYLQYPIDDTNNIYLYDLKPYQN
mgnify:CR=1 FL=1